MVEFEKENRFEEAFERGLHGQISNYEAWLQDQGFNPNRVSTEFVAQYFREHPKVAPNHADHLEEIAEFLGFFSRREGPFHIPVVGVTGIGKTQLLHTLNHMLDRLDVELPCRQYSAARFTEETESGDQYWDEVIAELAGLEKAVILLDNCDDDKRASYSLEKIRDTVEDVFIISVWTPERWNMAKDEIADTLTISKEVELMPFDEAATVEASEIIVDAISADAVELPHDLYHQIHDAGRGVPGLGHMILCTALKETFLQGLELGDVAAVDAAVQTLHLDGAEDRIYDLSDMKLLILKHILLARHPEGRRPSELVERLDRDKSTISYHLQDLIADNVLEKEKAGRSTFYRVSDPVKPIVQRRIAQEGELHA